jgi:tRNA G10  N-methylase Trm11
MKYFYKLGHQPELALKEFEFRTNSKATFYNPDWLLDDQKIEVNQFGSLIFAGKILAEFDLENQNKLLKNLNSDLKLILERFTETQEIPLKKIGLATYFKEKEENLIRKKFYGFLSKKIFAGIKTAGVKKINALENGKLPSFGNFSNTKYWLIFFNVGKKMFLGFIEDCYDQEFWAKLDSELPSKEMKKGLINLKLARTLLGFTNQKIIWDPFCGQNRNLIAGLDQKEEFWGSDIDPDCLVGAKQNFEFAQEFFTKKFFSLENIKLATLKNLQPLKANNLSKVKLVSKIDFSKVAIVTEGYLGKNFAFLPDNNMIIDEFKIINKLWQEVLSEAGKLQIPEIIFCIPFYQLPKEKVYPNFWSNLNQKSDYEFVDLGINSKFLTYARKDSITGHFILKMKLKTQV